VTVAPAVAGWAAAACGAAGAGVAAAFAHRALSVRSQRIARACHELRGPITAARLGLELGVRRGALSPARLKALDQELARAALAIDDLAASGGLPGRWEELDLHGLLRDSVEAWRGTADARGASLRLSWGGPPGFVRADRVRLAQATGNLIANAIEHGGGVVEVCAQAGAGPGGLVRVEFIDDGPGLPAPVDELARRGRRRRGPHGHGLAIAHGVVAAHGGRLAAAPSNRGARIVLELPLIGAQRGGAANFGDQGRPRRR
jgi:signal transduction histidine kinase